MHATTEEDVGTWYAHRRAFLKAAASLPIASALARAWPTGQVYAGQEARVANANNIELIPRQTNPINLEFPFHSLETFITPNRLFYARNHFAVPKIDIAAWRLRIEGAVERPLELSLEDLRKLAPRERTATLECAGNGRAFLVPRAKGVPWELGAVSNAEWSGVPLAVLLEKAGAKNQAVDVVFEGADAGAIGTEPRPVGQVHFARSIPIEHARRGHVLLAHAMNRQNLPENHGFPLRAIVPGWFGVASVKWLTRILVLDRPFQGFFQTIDYSVFEEHQGLARVVPITEIQVKSEIAQPAAGAVVKAGSKVRVFGAAWTGHADIVKVKIATDAGKTWSEARLLGDKVPFAWRLWDYTWSVPAAGGRFSIMSRATDSKGRTQPLKRDPNRRNYIINHVLPVEVEARA